MPDRVTTTATVATPTPERSARQLAAHVGRRFEVREDADGLRLVFGAGEGTDDGASIGDCLLRSREAALELSRARQTPPA